MLNHASRTRSPVGRTVRPLGTLSRRPLNSPAMMRSKARNSRLNRDPPLPVIALESEGNIQWLAQPFLGHMIGPAKSDRRQYARAVVEGEPQVIRSHASRPHRPRIAHAEDRSGISRPTRLEVANQSLQLFTHTRERQLEIDALAGREIVGREQLAGDPEERRAKRLEAVAADREARGPGVAAKLLEIRADPVPRPLQVESGTPRAHAP